MSKIDDLKQQAHDLVDQEKFEEAIPVFQQILKEDDSDHEAWYFLALTYIELENHDSAENALNKAIELDDNNTDYLLQMGYVKHLSGKINESSEYFHRILKIDPLNADAQSMLGLMAKDNENYEEAIEYLEASYSNEADVDTLISLIECLLDIGELDKVESKFELLSQSELIDEQYDEESELKTRFYLDKAMNSWTGTSTGEDGEILYFPETMEQIEDAEHFLECAEIQKPKDEFYINRIQQLKDVVETNKQDLKENEQIVTNSSVDSEYTEEDIKAMNLMDQVYDLWTYIEEEDGNEYQWPGNVLEVKESRKILNQVKKLNINLRM